MYNVYDDDDLDDLTDVLHSIEIQEDLDDDEGADPGEFGILYQSCAPSQE